MPPQYLPIVTPTESVLQRASKTSIVPSPSLYLLPSTAILMLCIMPVHAVRTAGVVGGRPRRLCIFGKAGADLHPGAQYRLGIAELNRELGLSERPKEGVKWLKRSAEYATAEFPRALHELALLHEKGLDNVVFMGNIYAAELLAQASELGHAPSAYRLGECYEYGKMGCPQDPALSIHYYVCPFSS